MKSINKLTLLLLLLLTSYCKGQTSSTCLTKLERSWLDGINDYRAKTGKHKLIYSEKLTLAACAQINQLEKTGSELEMLVAAPDYKGSVIPVYFKENPNYVGIQSFLSAWESDEIMREIINGEAGYHAFGICIYQDIHYLYFGNQIDNEIELVKCSEKENNYEWVINPELKYVKHFETEGAIAFRENNKWGFIDTTGTIIVPAEYFAVLWFDNSIACAQTMDEKAVIINRNNEIILKTDFYSLAPTQFKDRFIAGYSLTGPFVITDEHGKVLSEKYDDLDETYGDYFNVQKNGKGSIIDKNGKTILNKNYKELEGPAEGFYSFSENGKYGFMNENFEVTIKPEYTALIYYGFAHGLSHYGFANQKVGFINYKNEKVIPNIYDEAGLFNEQGHTFCSLEGNYGILNSDGSYLIDPQYEKIERSSKENNWITKKDGKFGLLNNQNLWSIEPLFDEMKFIGSNLYLVMYQGYWGLIRVKN